MMRIQAFIFDLDGTLIDSEILWVDAMVAYLADHGCGASRVDMMKVIFGRSWVDIHREVTARFAAVSAITRHQMAIQLRAYYLRQRTQVDSILIGSSVALLKQLAETYPVIVVSGSPHDDVQEAVNLMGAAASVKFVLGAEDYSPGKPSPAGFLAGAQRLGVPPEQCVVFEDSWAGVTAAKAAGMPCVALSRPTEHPQKLDAADWILEDLAQFSVDGLIARMNGRRVSVQDGRGPGQG